MQSRRSSQVLRTKQILGEVIKEKTNPSGRGAWCEDHHQELLLLPRKLKMMSPTRAVCGLSSICSVPGELQLDGAVRRCH